MGAVKKPDEFKRKDDFSKNPNNVDTSMGEEYMRLGKSQIFKTKKSMSANDLLKHKVKLVFHSEISLFYESECTIEEFFEDKIYKDKRLLSAQLDGVITSEGSFQSTGPR